MQTPGVEPYQHLRSDLPGVRPCPEELADGEIAVNTADGVAYYKDPQGAVQLLNGPAMALIAAQRAFANSLLEW
jgi:hypothetical protein